MGAGAKGLAGTGNEAKEGLLLPKCLVNPGRRPPRRRLFYAVVSSASRLAALTTTAAAAARSEFDFHRPQPIVRRLPGDEPAAAEFEDARAKAKRLKLPVVGRRDPVQRAELRDGAGFISRRRRHQRAADLLRFRFGFRPKASRTARPDGFDI